MVVFLASQWRGWATPWAQDPDIVAPNLERFGKESLVYTRAYTACPAVGEGYHSLLVGQFPPFPKTFDLYPLPSIAVTPALEFLEKKRRTGYFVVVEVEWPATAPSRVNPAHLH